MHALHSESSLACIQLGRYPHQIKIARPIELPTRLQLPIFVSEADLAVSWVEFEVLSVLVHLGRSPFSGHYRALLRSGDRWVYCNDHVQAAPTLITLEHKRGCYGLLLLKVRDSLR